MVIYVSLAGNSPRRATFFFASPKKKARKATRPPRSFAARMTALRCSQQAAGVERALIGNRAFTDPAPRTAAALLWGRIHPTFLSLKSSITLGSVAFPVGSNSFDRGLWSAACRSLARAGRINSTPRALQPPSAHPSLHPSGDPTTDVQTPAAIGFAPV